MSRHSKASVLERKSAHNRQVESKTAGNKEELDEEWTRLTNERKALAEERKAMVQDKTNLESKDKKLNGMFAELDDKESKLKMKLEYLEEQRDQWLRSATDLFRRETVMEDWQKNHEAREKRIQELDNEQEKRFNALLEREVVVTEGEQQLKTKEIEFQDKEKKLEQYLAKLQAREAGYASRDEKLMNLEGDLRKREGEIEIKEREIASRRRELESWDSMLREREKKTGAETRRIDEREDQLRALTEKCKLKAQETDERAAEVKEREDYLALQQKHFEAAQAVFEDKERSLDENTKKNRHWEGELRIKEETLNDLEEELKSRKEQLKQLESRELELQAKIERHLAIEKDFFTNRVDQIATRHASEMDQLEKCVVKLLQFVGAFRFELDRFKEQVYQNHKNNTNAAQLAVTKAVDATVSLDASADAAVALTTEDGAGQQEQTQAPPIHTLMSSYDELIADVKANVEKLKVLDDERCRAIDVSEKMEKASKSKVDSLPMHYGSNAAPNNGSTYSYQLNESYQDLCKVVEKNETAWKDPKMKPQESNKPTLLSAKKGWGFLRANLKKVA